MTAAAANDRVRVGAGVNGTVVVLGAWCSKCRREVMPTQTGFCAWGCGTFVVDEDTLSSSEMIAQLRALPEREQKAREETVPADLPPGAGSRLSAVSVNGEPGGRGGGADAVSRSENATRRPYKSRKKRWTRTKQLNAIRRWAAAHDGLPPKADDLRRANGLPSQSVLHATFGSFSAAVEAAGFARPTRGRSVKSSSGVDVDDSPAVPPEAAGEAPVPTVPASPRVDPGGASHDLEAVRAAALTAINAVFDLLEATEAACR